MYGRGRDAVSITPMITVSHWLFIVSTDRLMPLTRSKRETGNQSGRSERTGWKHLAIFCGALNPSSYISHGRYDWSVHGLNHGVGDAVYPADGIGV